MIYSAIPASIQLAFCHFAKSGWVKAIPIILMTLFWIANIIMAFLFSTPLLQEYATFFLGGDSFFTMSDQVLIAILGIFIIAVQALAWLITSLIQKVLRKGK